MIHQSIAEQVTTICTDINRDTSIEMCSSLVPEIIHPMPCPHRGDSSPQTPFPLPPTSCHFLGVFPSKKKKLARAHHPLEFPCPLWGGRGWINNIYHCKTEDHSVHVIVSEPVLLIHFHIMESWNRLSHENASENRWTNGTMQK